MFAGALPRSLDEFTPELISRFLSSAQREVTVSSFEVLELTNGTTTRARLALRYDAEVSLPETMWLKSSLNSYFESNTRWGLLEAEARFYQLSPQLSVRAPHAYFADFDSAGQSVVLLEDLSVEGVQFGLATSPLAFEDASAVLSALADFHSSTWHGRSGIDFSWFPNPVEGAHSQFFLTDSTSRLPRLFKGRRGDLIPDELRQPELVAKAYCQLEEFNATHAETFLHYDAHLGNTYIDGEGKGGLLDWQCARRGHWMSDVGYFLVSALTPEDRRKWEVDLLSGYLEHVAQKGLEVPAFDEAWYAYRFQPLYGLLIWMVTEPQMQDEEVCRANVQRFAIAAVDHDTLSMVS